MKRKLLGSGVGLLVVGALTLSAARADVVEQILVRVNGEIYTKSQLETRQIQQIRQMDRQLSQNASLSDAELRKMLDDITPGLIVDAVDEMLLVQHGKSLGYKLSDEQFNSVLENLKKENNIQSDTDLQAALKQEGMTMADLRNNMERSMIRSYVEQNEVQGRIAVNDDEARKYYDAHMTDFTTAQEVTLREIFIATPGDGTTINVGADEAARDKVAKIRERALAGEGFDKLAAEASDSPSKANGGLVGPLSLNELSPDLRKLLESMKPGQISDVLRTPRGYQVLRLESASTADTQTFEQARDEIGKRLFAVKQEAEVTKFLDRLRTEAIIEWKNPELKKSYDRGLAQQKATAAPLQ